MRRVAPLVASAALAAACAPSRSTATFDLVTAFPTAEVISEVHEIDLGTLEARPHLGVGWSVDETHRDGTTLVWAVGGSSDIRFFLTRPRKLGLVLRCSPFGWPGAPRQRVRVSVNGRKAGEAALRPGLRDVRVDVAAADAIAGENVVTLEFDHTGRPSDHGNPGDDRDLTARFDAIDLDGVADAGRPTVDASTATVVIPVGAELGYYLRPADRARLSFDAISTRDGATLELWWHVDGVPARLLAASGSDDSGRSLDLPDGGGRPLRLGLRAVGEIGEVAITRPRVTWADPITLERPSSIGEVRPPGGRQPNVLVYLVDTLRADRLGCYGNRDGLTPQIDVLAAEGVLFERVAAQSSWTKPSVASILTGLRPGRHGVNHRLSVLSEQALTMAEMLAEAGYETAGFSTNAYISTGGGFAQGFDQFQFRQARSHEVTDDVVRWLAAREERRPFFLYVHTVDPHAPYDPRPRFRSRFAAAVSDPVVGTVEHIRGLADRTVPFTTGVMDDLERLYDAEVAENDDAFGLLMEELRRRGLWQQTIVIFLSDHGEEFKEHGVIGHGWDLYGEVLDVPLIIRVPGGLRGVRVADVVQHIDVLPTVLEAVGAPVPEAAEGVSLWRAVHDGSTGSPQRVAYSYLDYEGRRGIAVRDGDWTMIEPLSRNFTAGRELYDREADPGERDDLAGQLPVRAGLLATWAGQEMARHGSGLPDNDGPEVEGATREALEALGYVR
jgi:choline-sulfatase